MALPVGLLVVAIALSAAGVNGHEEHDPHYWHHMAHDLLYEKKDFSMQKVNIAKNIVVFVGAGMSPPTVTAARTINGGDNETFAFERLKWSGNARTYCVDSRVPDSACAGTAFLTGVKSNFGTVAMHPTVNRGDCNAGTVAANKLESLAKWALDAGKAVGFATTSRVTSGSSAALYANAADSRWEADVDVVRAGCGTSPTADIAHQLIHGEVGKRFKVILGGGRKNFIPTTVTDAATGLPGLRTDGKDLLAEWKQSRTGNATYITTAAELATLDASKVDYLLGLFDYDHLPHSVDIVADGPTPRLVSLVHHSLEMLQKPEHRDGFLLFVEDGNIGRAHRQNRPYRAFRQVEHYGSAFGMANMMVSEKDTLILAMNDVGSTLSIAGYTERNSAVDSRAGVSDVDSRPYLGISYATGPAYGQFYEPSVGRLDPLPIVAGQTSEGDRTCPAAVPLADGADGGEDATVYASGPWSYLLSGGYEQNFIAHAVAFASCINQACDGATTGSLSAAALLLAVLAALRNA